MAKEYCVIENKKDFDNYIEKYIILKNGNLSSNYKKHGRFAFLEKYIDIYQKLGNSSLEKLYLYVNKFYIAKCKNCNKYLKFKTWSNPYSIFCSKRCAAKNIHNKRTIQEKNKITKKIKETNIDRYGKTNYVNPEKAKQTKLEKYGYTSPFQQKEIQEKIKKTNIKKYGVERQLSRKNIQEKIKETKLKKYGNENYNNIEKIKETNIKRYGGIGFSSSEILGKIKETNIDRYGVENISCSQKIKHKILNTNNNNFFKLLNNKWSDIKPLFNIDKYNGVNYNNIYEWQCLICDTKFEDDLYAGRKPRCPVCYPICKSIGEQNLVNYCNSLNLEVIENDRKLISPYEVDIYIPTKNLAIEYNGLYWHNIDHVDKYYHQRKVELAYRKGVRLLHIWEHDKEEDIKLIIQYYLDNKNKYIKVNKPKLYNIKDNLIWI